VTMTWRESGIEMVIARSKFPLVKVLGVLACLVSFTGCCAGASRTNTVVVVSRGRQIRSSTAGGVADLLEVSRGDTVDILDAVDIPDPSDNTKKERWYRVKARDADATEGWIEARNIMPEDVMAKSRKLADDDKNIQAQGTGQLHAG